jgi:exosortase/archaeosortase family protein
VSARRLFASPRLRVLLALAAIGLLLKLLEAADRRGEEVLAPADRVTAAATAGLLRTLGMTVWRDGAVLAHPDGFSYEIYYPCSEWLIVLCMAVGLLALPGRGRDKVLYALAGGTVLAILNQVRLVHLFWTGVHRPAAFDLWHRAVWEPVMLLSVMALWALWLRGQRRRQEVFR